MLADEYNHRSPALRRDRYLKYLKSFLKSKDNRPTSVDAPLEAVDLTCPYCSHALVTTPEWIERCPSCGQYFLARAERLVTEEEAKKLGQLEHLEPFGVSERDYERHEQILFERFGKQHSVRDVIWLIHNELVSRTSDFQELKSLHYIMALFLVDEGRDPFSMLQQANKAELMYYKKSGTCDKVQVLTAGNGCEACETLSGKVFTIDEALAEMPLPNKTCTHSRSSEKHSSCRCSYLACSDR